MKKLNGWGKAVLWVVVGIVSAAFSHYLIELLYYGGYDYAGVYDWLVNSKFELFLLGTAVLFLFYLLFSSLSGSSFLGSAGVIFLSGILGTAARYKGIYRTEPLYPNELYMVKELPSLLQMIGAKDAFTLVAGFVSIGVLLFLFYRFIIKPKRKNAPSENKKIFRVAGTGIALILLFYVGRFNYPDNQFKKIYDHYAEWITFDQNHNYSLNGFVAGFLSNLKAPPMDTPENYSETAIKEIYEKYSNKAQAANQTRENKDLDTNVLFVMNESFTDPFNLEGIDSDKDPLTNYRELTAQTLNGKLLAPTLGGGTDISEFEALTGFLMEPFAPQISSPFIQLTGQMARLPSLPEKFNRLDYKTTAIHPYLPSFYRRNDVYKNLGFDEFRHEKNMTHTEKVTEEHRYISDSAAYKEIFDVMQNSKEPDFVHVVTMQNHTSYKEKYESVDFSTTGSGNHAEANAYFQDLYYSDTAIKQLIQFIDEFEEPVLLVFWGDHLPGFYVGEMLDLNEWETLYETPFFVYSNQVETTGEKELLSPGFLRNYVTEFLDLKMTPYEALLKELESYLPVVDKRLYVEQQNAQHVSSRQDLSEESLVVLEDYTLLMYDVTTGNQYANKLGFFE